MPVGRKLLETLLAQASFLSYSPIDCVYWHPSAVAIYVAPSLSSTNCQEAVYPALGFGYEGRTWDLVFPRFNGPHTTPYTFCF